jgi:hypothetical protein
MRRTALLLAIVASLAVAFTVQSATKPAGKLKVVVPGVALELKIAEKPVPVPNGREVPLPAGTYNPAKITCYAPDKTSGKQVMWSIQCITAFGEVKELAVAEGETLEVKAGPPFTIKPIIYKASVKAGQKTVPIGLSILGAAKESYLTSSIMKGLAKVPPPRLRVVDEKGTLLGEGAFEYG